MADFPTLKSGAVAQDGSQVGVRFGTRVLRFAEGAEQRFRDRKGPRRRWTIRLDQLTDEELSALTQFIGSRQGRHGTFSFFDPWSEVEYGNCSLESDIQESDLRGLARAAVTIRIAQNWS